VTPINTETPATDDSIAADTLYGAKAIGEFIGEDEKRTFYLIGRGYVPAGKIGACWTASKAVLREHYARVTRGPAEPPLPPLARTSSRRRPTRPPAVRRSRPRRIARPVARVERDIDDLGPPRP
jgi:hypothetical protein